jgi:hypothetical protein
MNVWCHTHDDYDLGYIHHSFPSKAIVITLVRLVSQSVSRHCKWYRTIPYRRNHWKRRKKEERSEGREERKNIDTRHHRTRDEMRWNEMRWDETAFTKVTFKSHAAQTKKSLKIALPRHWECTLAWSYCLSLCIPHNRSHPRYITCNSLHLISSHLTWTFCLRVPFHLWSLSTVYCLICYCCVFFFIYLRLSFW